MTWRSQHLIAIDIRHARNTHMRVPSSFLMEDPLTRPAIDVCQADIDVPRRALWMKALSSRRLQLVTVAMLTVL